MLSQPCFCFLVFTDPKANEESSRLVIDNAENLMNAVGEVLNATESALKKVPPNFRSHLTGLNWVKR